jgi:hypothetical protein
MSSIEEEQGKLYIKRKKSVPLQIDDDEKIENFYIKKQSTPMKVEEDEERLLQDPTVIQWLRGDLSFLSSQTQAAENEWGRKIMRRIRPDLVNHSHWTSKFGEYIAQELYEDLGYSIKPAKKIENHLPDLDAGDFIIEVKTSTYLTHGTANEKILGCPLKYKEVPTLYGKPLVILCLGGAERDCRTKYKNLGKPITVADKIIFNCLQSLKVEFKGASELLQR